MLEMLLMTYESQFGKRFPLEDFSECKEIELINILYECLEKNDPNIKQAPEINRFPDAPGQLHKIQLTRLS